MRRKLIFNSGVGAAAAALLSSVVPAGAADTLEPGLWSIATRVGRGDREVPLHKVERCITTDQAKDFGSWTALKWAGKDTDCKSTNYRKTAEGGTFTIHCSGRTSFDATATFTLRSPQNYTLVVAT